MIDPTPKLKKLRKAMQKANVKHNRKAKNYEATVEAVFALRFFFSQGEEMKTKDRLICKAMESLEVSQHHLMKELTKTRKEADAARKTYWKAHRAHRKSKEASSND